MLFNSYAFLFAFLPVALLGFHVAALAGRSTAACWLVLASVCFYGWWNPPFVVLLLGSIAFNFACGHLIAAASVRPRLQSGLLAGGIAANLALLVWFKYLASLLGCLRAWGVLDLPFAATVLPLGISFFTFTQIGYLVDVRQGVARDRGLLSYVLFVTFFPHLIAGPILHNREIMPQFADPATYRLSGQNLCVGATIFVIGLLKKTLLADPLSASVQAGFGQAQGIGFVASWIAVLLYSMQLYFDFSGYSDMAIGLARMFNVRFPLNFNSPYKATGIIDYWQRFHMTLTRYITLYLFNPMAMAVTRRRALRGKDCSRRATTTPGGFSSLLLLPTMMTMALAGIWHGSGLQYLVFGLLHGAYIATNHARRIFGGRYARADGPLLHILYVALTYLCACVAFVFFRAPSLAAAGDMLAGMLGLHGFAASPATAPEAAKATRELACLAVLYGIVWFLPNTQQIMALYQPALGRIAPGPLPWLRWRLSLPSAIAFGLGALVALLTVGGTSEFLYFQF